MNVKKAFLLFICCLLFFCSGGCSTTQTISRNISYDYSSQSIQAFIENPSGSSLSLKEGENIDIYLKEMISISSISVTIINMNLIDVDTTRIKGEIVIVCCSADDEEDIIRGNIIEVKLTEIDFIRRNIRGKYKLKDGFAIHRVEQPGSSLAVKSGEFIEIFTKHNIGLDIYEAHDAHQTSTKLTKELKLQVVDSNPERISGKLIYVTNDETGAFLFNHHKDNVVEVKLEDIDFIRIESDKEIIPKKYGSNEWWWNEFWYAFATQLFTILVIAAQI